MVEKHSALRNSGSDNYIIVKLLHGFQSEVAVTVYTYA